MCSLSGSISYDDPRTSTVILRDKTTVRPWSMTKQQFEAVAHNKLISLMLAFRGFSNLMSHHLPETLYNNYWEAKFGHSFVDDVCLVSATVQAFNSPSSDIILTQLRSFHVIVVVRNRLSSHLQDLLYCFDNNRCVLVSKTWCCVRKQVPVCSENTSAASPCLFWCFDKIYASQWAGGIMLLSPERV